MATLASLQSEKADLEESIGIVTRNGGAVTISINGRTITRPPLQWLQDRLDSVNVQIGAFVTEGKGAAYLLGGQISYNRNRIITSSTTTGSDSTGETPLLPPTPAVDHVTRAAITMADTAITEADYNRATSTRTHVITTPMWASGRRDIWIGVPESENDITAIYTGTFNVFTSFERVNGVAFGHKWWRTVDDQSTASSGIQYTFSQA